MCQSLMQVLTGFWLAVDSKWMQIVRMIMVVMVSLIQGYTEEETDLRFLTTYPGVKLQDMTHTSAR